MFKLKMPAAKNIGLHQTGEKVLDASNGDEFVLEVRGGAITRQMMPYRRSAQSKEAF